MQTVLVNGRVFNYSHAMGMGSDGGIGFRGSVDLALSSEGVVYVLSRGSDANQVQRVTVLTMDEEFIREFGGPGEEDGQFVWPTAIAFDSDGLLYLADEWLNRISVFDQDGNFIRKWGIPGTEDGQLNGPAGLACDKEDNFYITENLNHRVQKFTKDGRFLLRWGKKGTLEGELTRPWGIALDTYDNVYVADWYNNRVQKFQPDGKFLSCFGTPEAEPGHLTLPSDVAVDCDGDVYITNWWNRTVEVYDPDGIHLTTFIGNAELPSKWAQDFLDANPDYKKARQLVNNLEPEWRFYNPVAIEISVDRKILILEDQRWRIQVYQKEEAWVEPQFNL